MKTTKRNARTATIFNNIMTGILRHYGIKEDMSLKEMYDAAALSIIDDFNFIDKNGKTPLDEEWSFEKLAKWFELDYNDLVVVRKSLDTYLHPEEQKVIEETIDKYK